MNDKTAHTGNHPRGDTRAFASYAVAAVFAEGHSLNDVLPAARDKVAPNDRGLLAELCYGTLRHYFELDGLTTLLIPKPLAEKDSEIQALILIGLYQLRHMRLASHTAVNLTVNACKALDKPWAVKLVNGVLRNYLRNVDELNAQLHRVPTAYHNHPQWLVDAIEQAWPEEAEEVMDANNQQGGMTLRVNTRQISTEAYQALLEQEGIASTRSNFAPHALYLARAVSVEALPNFAEGACSVQDIAAQLCAPLLQLAPGQHVLDACAAPGGKTCHALELESDLAELLALDNERHRLTLVKENLDRLHLKAKTLCADAADTASWHKGTLFDRIMLDAPCSGTGVIRRHPDIKLLRRDSDIAALAKKQLHLLSALWPLLAPNGILLYTTCSILPMENEDVIATFIRQHSDAQVDTIESRWGIPLAYGKQLLPRTDDEENHDGFYFSRLHKVTP